MMWWVTGIASILLIGSAHATGWTDFVQVVDIKLPTEGENPHLISVVTSGESNPDGCDSSTPYVLLDTPTHQDWLGDESPLEMLKSAHSKGEPVALRLFGCRGTQPVIRSVARVPTVASSIAKAAIYVFSTDFIHEEIEEEFNGKELEILANHKVELSSMIGSALDLQNSVGGAKLSAYFRMQESLRLLRYRLLDPGRTYGWEGPDYSQESAYLADEQYVYHSVYLEAIETITSRPIHEAVKLEDKERESLKSLANDRGHESHYWARWLLMKLDGPVAEPQPALSDPPPAAP